jgi:hypothetical protein
VFGALKAGTSYTLGSAQGFNRERVNKFCDVLDINVEDNKIDAIIFYNLLASEFKFKF